MLFFSAHTRAAISGVVDFQAQARLSEIELHWQKTQLSEMQSIVIIRKESTCPVVPFDGTEIYRGNGTSFIDATVQKKRTYCYGAFLLDISGFISPLEVSGLVQEKNIFAWLAQLLEENSFIAVGLLCIVFLLRLNAKKKKKLMLLVH